MAVITVVTGTRAEYGLLRPVLQKLAARPALCCRLAVTGAHLSPQYGSTVEEIEADGFAIDARLDILSRPAPPGREGTALRCRLALELFLEYFTRRRPDAVLLLGDRYEAFAAGQAAALLGIPLIHISGGDVTAGADDDWFRHCLTKMASLHFPSCEAYRERVIRMGEEPGRVFNVGGLGDEVIRSACLMPPEELAASLGFGSLEGLLLVTMHPETRSPLSPAEQAGRLLGALAAFPGHSLLFTGANADAGGDEMNRLYEQFCAGRQNARFVHSLGSRRYLSAMRHAAAVVGNSSSGVVETPSLGVPALDIGERQAGRIGGENLLRCRLEKADIEAGLRRVLAPAFCRVAAEAKSPYNGGDTSGRIAAVVCDFIESGRLFSQKHFYDAGPLPGAGPDEKAGSHASAE